MLTARQMMVLLVAACAATCDATAQDAPERVLRPLLGKVVDAEGNGIAGAEVHLSYSPVGATGDSASEHKIATSDQRGRFRFQAQPCTKHLIWAIGTPDDNGYRLVTTVQWISPGRPFELVADNNHPVSKLTINGVESWAGYAPLRVTMAPGGIPLQDMRVDLGQSGSCTLPPLPGGLTSVTIHDKDSQPLARFSISKHEQSIKRTLKAMQELPLLVVDPQGKPIAGATIRQRIRGNGLLRNGLTPSLPNRYLWREHGKTNADGKLIAKVASGDKVFEQSRWQGLFFTATKEGLNSTHSGIGEMPFIDGMQVEREGLTELKFTLKEAKPTILRLMSSQERGLANQRVTVKTDIRIRQLNNRSWGNESLVFDLTTDNDGVLRFPALTQAIGGFQVLLGGASVTELISEPLRRMSPYRAVTLHEVKSKPGEEQRIDLHKTAKIKLQMLGEHGGPVTDAELILISRANKNNYDCDGWNTMATTDSAGRVALQMQPGRWSVFVRSKGCMAHLLLKLEANETKELNVTLKKMPTMHGRVIDSDGKPIANLQMNCHSSTWHNAGERNPILEAIAQNMNWSWIDGTKTDKDGMFACSYLELSGLTYEVRFRMGKKQSADFQVMPNDSPVTIIVK